MKMPFSPRRMKRPSEVQVQYPCAPKCLPNEGAKCRQTISITYNIITIIKLTYEACVPILTPVGWRSNLSFGEESLKC